MKSFILASVLVSAISVSAFAGELCGTLGTHTVGPKCGAGQFCPMFVRLQYDITAADGTRYDLETSSSDILENFGQLNGEKVCVNGSEDIGNFEVSTISAQ